MTIQQAINNAKALTGQVVENATLVRWLSELDGRLAFEFYRADVWTPYDPVNDLNAELLVPFPWDGLYVHHLEAMTYFSDAEYDRYENARTLGEKTLADFRAFMQRTSAPRCGGGFPTEKTGGTGTTIIPALTESPWFWISAYSIAVKHGYSGTEAEFAAMMEEAHNTAEEAHDTAEEALEAAESAKTVKISYTESAETAYTKANGAYSNHSPCYVEKNGALYWLVKRTKINNNQEQKSYITFYFSSISSYGDFRTVSITATVPYPNISGDTSYGWGSFNASPIPSGAGTYVLKATRATAGAAPTYEWVAEE